MESSENVSFNQGWDSSTKVLQRWGRSVRGLRATAGITTLMMAHATETGESEGEIIKISGSDDEALNQEREKGYELKTVWKLVANTIWREKT